MTQLLPGFREPNRSSYAPGFARHALGGGHGWDIEAEMKRIKINAFVFSVGRSKDKSAEGKWCHRTLSYQEVRKVLCEFNFEEGYNKRPSRGRSLQDSIRQWMLMIDDLQVWPGDGPETNAEELFEKHSEFMIDLLDGGEGDPGEDGFEESGFPTHFMTPYAHTWVNHIGEMYDRSKKLAHLFSESAPLDGTSTRGGLKPFRTDALERQNLKFFHTYFQILTRRPATVLREAGIGFLRKLVNPMSCNRSTIFCRHCARGFQYPTSLRKHEAACRQAPQRRNSASEDDSD